MLTGEKMNMHKNLSLPSTKKVSKVKKPHKTVKSSHEEDFDVQYWSDKEVNELVSSYSSQRYTERNYDDFDL